MARMSLDTAIRLSAEVKGGGNITKVQRSLQDLAKGSQVTAREMQTLRSATFQYARANDGTIAGIRNSITAFRGLQEQAKIGGREFQRYGSEIQKLEGKLRGIDGTAEKAGRSMGQNLASGLAAGLAAAGIGQAIRGSLEAVVASEESQRRLRSLSTGLDDYSKVQATATAAAQKFGVAQTQANQEFAQIYARLRPVGLTLEEISTVYNGFNTAAKLSGTTSAEASAAFLQLSQALGTGVLRGEELNSVFEQTPAVVQGIAQVMGVPIGQIRELAKEGKISGDIVLEALKRIERDGAPKLAEAMKGPAQQFKNLGNEGVKLQEQLGKALLPTAIALTKAATALLQETNKLPAPVKAFGGTAALAGIAVLGLVTAAAALKAGLATLGITGASTALKGLAVSAGTAGNASALAAGKVKVLGGALASIARIGIITAAVSVVISGLDKLREVQLRIDSIRNSGTQAFGAQIGGSALTKSSIDRLINENRAEFQARKRELESVRFPALTGQDEIARAALLQLDTRLAKLQSMRERAPLAAPSAPVPNALSTPIGATVGGGGAAASGGAKPKEQSAEDRIAAKPFGREIIAAARANNVDPALLAALVAQESNFNQQAVSRSGAIGLTQLMPGTAQELGVNPRDPLQNLMGGAKYLRQQLDRFGLEGGLRAYNQGPGAQQRTPGGNSQESREYPGRVLALYEQFAGGGEGLADLAAAGLQSQAEAAEKMREQKEAADALLITERNRLEVLQESDPMQKTIVESMIKELAIQDEFEKKLKDSLSVEETKSLALAEQNAIKSNTVELERELSGLTKDAAKPLQDALTESGNRLAYEREYGQLLAQGINPELAKQFVELDRIASIAKTNLELQIAMLEARAAELPIASETRKELERQIQLRKEQLNLIPGTVAQTRNNIIAAGERTPAENISARIGVIKGEIEQLTDVGQVAIASADNIGNAFGTAFSGLISGASSAREALAGFFRDLAANFLEMASQIIAKQITLIVLQNILKSLGVGFGGGIGGGLGFGGASDPLAAGGAFWNADGNAFGGGGVVPFANGGTFTNNIVSSPTLFKFASGGAMQTGVMGEAGPEAIMPLRRGPGGRLGVDASGGGGGGDTVNQVTVNVDAKGSNVAGDDNTSRRLGTVVADAVQAELVKQQRPGGLLDRNRTKSR